MIGVDFPKIEFELFGMQLLEPMALITDSILGILGVFLAYKISKIKSALLFYKYWKLFFLLFGIGAFVGGLGHAFYNQWSFYGKIPSWLFGPVSIYFAEKAMISSHWDNGKKKVFNKIADSKLILVYIAWVLILFFGNEDKVSTQPFLPIAINTILGLLTFVGYLGFKYTEKFSAKFKFFWLGVLILIPTAFIFLLKINVHQWFDKNDMSHILMMLAVVYFYLGVKKVSEGLKQKN